MTFSVLNGAFVPSSAIVKPPKLLQSQRGAALLRSRGLANYEPNDHAKIIIAMTHHYDFSRAKEVLLAG